MRILILGGTVFVGRHLAEIARDRGHDVTLFHRGTRPGAMPDFEHLHGDRDEPGGLDALRDRDWDAVIDTSAYVPRQVREALGVVSTRSRRYAFVSSVAVYADPAAGPPDEDATLASLDDPETETVDGQTYGGLKVACERVAREVLGDRALIVRPGVVVGPHDPTERFTYWVRRMTRSGPVLVPDAVDAPVQWIDARDLATFVLTGLENDLGGTFNVVSEEGAHTLGDLLDACGTAAGTHPHRTLVPEAFLREQGVSAWSDLPLWLPPEAANLMRTVATRARDAGLTTRPLIDTVRDVLAWDLGRGSDAWNDPLPSQREAEVLAAWRDHDAGQSHT
jgi:2'-hydroxyisoflavone reductase